MKFPQIISIVAILAATAHAIPAATGNKTTATQTMTGIQIKNAFLTETHLSANQTKTLKDAPESFWNSFADLANKVKAMPENSTDTSLKKQLETAASKLLKGEIPNLSGKPTPKKTSKRADRPPMTAAEMKQSTLEMYNQRLVKTNKLKFFQGLSMDDWGKLAKFEDKAVNSINPTTFKMDRKIQAQHKKVWDMLFAGQMPDLTKL
ncbi:hypothetical protein AA313_de0204873 [Arthrobotrys entomopaga]|nr:hypothetical protein AA313_de0204873 [Arthrobotrys entomopaga]